MKHTLTILSFAALSFFFGCNKMETIQNPDGSITVIASVNLAQTKALASDGKKTFSVDDQLAVIYRQEGGGTAVAVSEKLTAGDIQRDGKYAKFHVTFTDPDKSELVTYVYPANMAKNDGTINYDALKNGQDGTLSKISSDLDLCTKDVSWSGSSLPDGTALENQLTVAQFKIKDSDTSSDITSSLTRLMVSNGSDVYTVTLSSKTTVWVAMKPITTGDILFEATDGSYNYTKTVTGQTMSLGTLYSDITVSMVKGEPFGAINGLFTINSSHDQVYFSQGNLQYVGTWRFAAHQYDIIGNSQADNNRDLFGWGTKTTPNNTSTNAGDYSWAEWGENTITNGTTGYRTLTSNEWSYLFIDRTSTSGVRYAKATVNGMAGVILVPDNWSTGYYTLAYTNDESAAFTSNTIDAFTWANSLEAHGAVFLPAGGSRNGESVSGGGSFGIYWSSSWSDSDNAYYAIFSAYDLGPQDSGSRAYGLSVRLVKEK